MRIKQLVSLISSLALCSALFFAIPIPAYATTSVKLSADQQWIDGLNSNMEYITETAYLLNSASSAHHRSWTSLTGGTRTDGSKYGGFALVAGHKLQVASAWYGEDVYFRTKGSTGKGTAVAIPEYSQLDAQYKRTIKVLNAYPPDTTQSFYAHYLTAVSDANGYLLDTPEPIHLSISKVSIVSFNQVPDSYLKDAEGNYIYDLVAIGANTNDEPDISGAAAWALQEYIKEGYGFLIGHDTIYSYGGVHPDAHYLPDKTDTRTPMYVANTKIDGHWNMNWLMGVNKPYDHASPYESNSLILSSGDYHDKSALYGDAYETSTLRVTAQVSGNPDTEVDARTPTNYPYDMKSNGEALHQGRTFQSGATHTNLQLAYGKIWIDFASNTLNGKELTNRNDGLVGKNNFYLTTNGNFGMSQIGHTQDNLFGARIDECRILANTILYLSQREPCEICRSKQNGSTQVHAVTRISSAEQLSKIGHPQYRATYPLDGCYLLTEDITLPADWQPIADFSGHFHADNHLITGAASVFAKDGIATENQDGWNLGTAPEHGNPKISNSAHKTTGVARISGYLNQLFGTDSRTDYSRYTIVVQGSDGNTYSSTSNREGKYLISNLPVTSERMTAQLYDQNDKLVTEYGGIYAKVAENAWNNNQTMPLRLEVERARAIPDQTVYEGMDVLFVGGLNGSVMPDKMTWMYRGGFTSSWQPLKSNYLFEYEISKAELITGETPYIESSLKILDAKTQIDDFQFKIVFELNGAIYDTADIQTEGHAGRLFVKERPYVLGAVADATVWQGEQTSFVASLEYYQHLDDALTVRWQYRGNASATWESVEGSKIVTGASIDNLVQTTNAPDMGYLNQSVLHLTNVPTDIQGYQFRAVFEHEKRDRTFASDEVNTTGKQGQITVRIKTVDCIEHPQNIATTTSGNVVSGSYQYTASFEWKAPNPSAQISWEYKPNSNASYTAMSNYPYSDSISVSPAKQIGIDSYLITTTLTLTNPPIEIDKGDNHFYFRASFDNGIKAYSGSADFSLNYRIDIKPSEPIVRFSADGKQKIYSYPNLTVFAPEGVRMMRVGFESNSLFAQNSIAALTSLGGVTAVESNKGYLYNSTTPLSATVLQNYLRKMEFTVGSSQDANVEWQISSERMAGNYDVHSGKYYEFIPASGFTWTQSYEDAKTKYNDVLQVQGQLATIKTQAQQDFVHALVGNRTAWIGATNDRNYNGGSSHYLWVDKTGFPYNNFNTIESGTRYARMLPNGKWEAATNTNKAYLTFTNLISMRTNATLWHGYSETDYVPFVQGHQYYIYYHADRGNGWLNNGAVYYNYSSPFNYGIMAHMYHHTPWGWKTSLGVPSGYKNHPMYHTWLYSKGQEFKTFDKASGTYPVTMSATFGTQGSESGWGDWELINYGAMLIDLTAAFGSNEALNASNITGKWLSDNIGVFQGSKSLESTSNQSNADGYVVEYIINDNAPSHTAKSAKATDILAGVRVGEIPPAIIQSSEYRANTDVLFSVEVTALADINPEHTASATFTVTSQDGRVQAFTYTDICLPAGKSQRAYVQYSIPDVVGALKVTVQTSSNIFSNIAEIHGNVTRVSENTPPNPVYVDHAPVFTASAPPTYPNSVQHVWVTYTARKSGAIWQYTEHENRASLNSFLQIQPDAQVPTNAHDTIKSGYGINETVTAIFQSDGTILPPQTVVAYYPEFRYAGYWRLLEPTATPVNQVVFSLKKNAYSQTDARVHFLPLWYPDSRYIAYATVRDAWTPVGELQQAVTDDIEVNQTVFDDWYIGAMPS